MGNRTTAGFVLLTLAVMVGIAGCNGNGAPKDLQKFVEKTKQNAKNNLKNKQNGKIDLPMPMTYKAEPLRAPFEQESLATPEKKVAATPLQAYPVNMLKLVGTVTQGSHIFAYVVAPDQMTYRVDQGDRIGDHEGVVTSIEIGRINVMEEDTSSAGGNAKMQRIVTLELKEAQ